MKITTTKIKNFLTLLRLASYDNGFKGEYKKLGQSILRQLAKDMGLQKGEFDVRWNPGGIAIPGDHTLHTDKIYVDFSDNLKMGWFFWRKCHGRKDYGTGMDCPNQIVNWETLLNGGWDGLVQTLKRAQFEK